MVAAILGVRYSGGSSAGRLDRVADPSLLHLAGGDRGLADGLVALGGPVAVTVWTVLLLAVLVHLRWPRAAVLAALAAPAASAVTELVLKPLVERTRGGSLSYPSGHTTGIFAVAMVVTLLMASVPAARLAAATRLAAAAAALGTAGTVATASVAADDHYATDTVGGACVAVATVLCLSLVLDAVADRWHP